MMPFIRESIVTTLRDDGTPHIAPLGLHEDGDRLIVAPFKPSGTLDNLRTWGFAVVNYTDDVRIYAGCLTGRRDWPTRPAERIEGAVLDGALAHAELEVVDIQEDEQRPRFICRIVHEAMHKPFHGFNRAQSAVIEAAILTSRLSMLPRKKLETELAYLRISIDKTAGDRELEAWGWLMEKIDAHWERESLFVDPRHQ